MPMICARVTQLAMEIIFVKTVNQVYIFLSLFTHLVKSDLPCPLYLQGEQVTVQATRSGPIASYSAQQCVHAHRCFYLLILLYIILGLTQKNSFSHVIVKFC